MHRHERMPFFDASEIAVHFIVAKAKTGQPPGKPANSASDRYTADGSDDRSSRYQRPDSRERERANAGQPPQHATDHPARSRADCRAFGTLVIFNRLQCLRRCNVGQHYGDPGISEVSLAQRAYDVLGLCAVLCHTNDRPGHRVPPNFSL
jgi:hypothetical protein